MSKERLEEWEQLWNAGYVKFVPELFEYARQQADRVQELDEEINKLDQDVYRLERLEANISIENQKLEQRNKRYREALEFYADEKTYKLGVNISMGSAFPKHEPIKYDKGYKAGKALEESK